MTDRSSTDAPAPTADAAGGSQRTGLEGRLIASGQLVDGQLLVWETTEEVATATTESQVFGQPLEAVYVKDGEFNIDVEPGWYRLKAAGLYGVGRCGTAVVEVLAGEITRIDFNCPAG